MKLLKIKLFWLTVLLSISFSALSNLSAQTYDTLWTKLFYNEFLSITSQVFGQAAVELPDGSIVAAGHCTDPFIKAFIVKTDANGNELWRKKYFDDIMKSFVCSDMKPTPDGGFALFGYSQSGVTLLQNGFRLLKLNASGDYLWDKFYPVSYSADTVCAAERLIVAPDGGFVMVGSNSFYLGLRLVGCGVAMKADALGNLLWQKNYGASDRFDYFLGVENDYGSGYVMCGYSESGPDSIQGGDMLFVKTDENGNQTDIVFHGTMNTFDEASTIRKSNDGGFIVGGAWGENGIQMSLIKLTAGLGFSWIQEYGVGEEYQYGCAANTSVNGHYLLAGWHIYGSNPSNEHWFVVSDGSGSMIWDITYRTLGLASLPRSVEPTSDGGFLVCGIEETSPGISAMLLVRIGPGTTGVEDTEILADYKLMQNFPNPFNPSTTIEYNITEQEQVILKIYDAIGNEITTLVDGLKSKGRHSVVLDGSNLSSGVYFYKIEAGNFSNTKKIVLLK
jgi:hypothetical protein